MKKIPNKKMTELQEKIARLVELMSKKYMKESKPVNSKTGSGQKYSKIVAAEAVRDLIDDYHVAIEMLIDEHYGDLDPNKFKKQWMDIADNFELQMSTLLSNFKKNL